MKTSMPTVAACLAALTSDAEPEAPAAPDPHSPILHLSRVELDTAIQHGTLAAACLALLVRDEGYVLAVFGAGGPALAELPAPFVATFGDVEGQVRGPWGHDRGTVERVVRAADAVVVSLPDDAEAELAGLAAVAAERGSVVFVSTDLDMVGSWLRELRILRPDLPLLAAGLCRPASVVLN